MRVRVKTDDGSETIVAVGAEDAESVLKGHGFDPDSVDWSVQKSVTKRLDDMEQGVGVEDGGKRGVAQRIDELEDRIEDLEDAQ